MKLYLAGPMTGLPHLNHPMFDRVTARLRAAGHVVISPAEKDREWGQDAALAAKGKNSLNIHEVLRYDLKVVLDVEALVLLPSWRRSEGTRLEVIVAVSTGRRIFFWSEQNQEMIELPISEVSDLIGIPSYARKAPAA